MSSFWWNILFISSESETGVNKYLSERFLLCGFKANPQSTRTVLFQFTNSFIIAWERTAIWNAIEKIFKNHSLFFKRVYWAFPENRVVGSFLGREGLLVKTSTSQWTFYIREMEILEGVWLGNVREMGMFWTPFLSTFVQPQVIGRVL